VVAVVALIALVAAAFTTDTAEAANRFAVVGVENTTYVTAVQVSGDPAGGSGDFLGYWTRSGRGRHEVPGFCCPD
jgi:peptidoglycan/LPS O-acetylase OafA/YrhL